MAFPPAMKPPARLIVDLAALSENYRTICTLAEGGSKPSQVAAVVKADAYGLGMPAVARSLFAAGCRSFFTAFSHEGLALRQTLGDGVEIFVLIPTLGFSKAAGESAATPPIASDPARGSDLGIARGIDSEIDRMRRHRLIPCLFDLAGIDRWIEGTKEAKAPVALHVETGINRLGLAPEDLASLLQDPLRRNRLDIVLSMSHLANADDPADPANQEQGRRFRALLRDFPGIRASLANSAGAFLGPEYHFDLLRPGIALYGHDPHGLLGHGPSGIAPRLRPVATLQAQLGQVREVPAGGRIGYGGKARCHGARRVGVVLAGYADGIPRSLYRSEGAAEASIDGHRIPFFGAVSMDMTTLDLSDVPASSARPGAWVDFFGVDPPIEEVAERAGTIPYEILAGIGPRVERVYVRGMSEGGIDMHPAEPIDA